MHLELTRERIFPLLVVTLMLVVAVGSFVLFDAAQGITAKSAAGIARGWANFSYWLLYKSHDGVSAYATAPSAKSARSVPVLVYHGEGEQTIKTAVALPLFVEHLRSLKREGWNTITLQQFEDFMKGRADLPDKSFLLTFDDGRRDTYYPFDPAIREMGFNAVMFVITAFSLPERGKPLSFYLNKSELQYMLDSGRWELQSHGDQDHRVYRVQSTTDLSKEAQTVEGNFLSNIFWNNDADRFETMDEYAARIEADLIRSKHSLEKHFGIAITSFAFPFNDFGQMSVNFPGAQDVVRDVVKDAYTFSYYQTWPGNGDSYNYPDPSTFMIRRIEPRSDWSAEHLMQVLADGRAKELPYAVTDFGSDLVASWGLVHTGDTLELEALPDTSGASAFLNGSGWWRDYEARAQVQWQDGDAIAILARSEDGIRYVGCVYSKDGVTIEERSGASQKSIARHLVPLPKGNLSIGIGVRANEVYCLLGEDIVASAQTHAPARGGIGAHVWSEIPGLARGSFTSVDVRAL